MPDLVVRRVGLVDYAPAHRAMLDFTEQRSANTADEFWLVQHPPVYTQGQAGKAEHLLNPGNIPVVQTERGGQVTYHGPGQIVLYPLLNLKRLKIGVRDLVTALETSIVQCLAHYDIEAYPKADAPGVYVQRQGVEHKIASLGLRVRKGCSLHGLALNTDMDLAPFLAINPCGYAGLPMTQVVDCLPGEKKASFDDVQEHLWQSLWRNLRYNGWQEANGLPNLNQ
ncbi:lipoyl(octanoyl) transferase LipB [Halioxenophilus aromaticivorans]|uniref:lipoyl(octanoyl) transferase LipB n=1 Tax=Halioxenophilus aromaticivorans TaxID=1306992 RepID=UPI0031E82D21